MTPLYSSSSFTVRLCVHRQLQSITFDFHACTGCCISLTLAIYCSYSQPNTFLLQLTFSLWLKGIARFFQAVPLGDVQHKYKNPAVNSDAPVQ